MVYSELQDKDKGFELVAVALDTAGRDAVMAKARPTDLDQRPAVLRPLRAWSEADWSRMSVPTFPCLIDEEHWVAELFGMVNVPTAVWIDEQGRIVRPAEPAGVGDEFRAMDPETFEVPADVAERQIRRRGQYLDALRDWVSNGSASRYALPEDEVLRRTRRPGEADVRAAAHGRIARHLYALGSRDAAARHLTAAADLCPDKWHFRRQSMVLDPDTVGQLNVAPDFWDRLDALGEQRYYPPIDMPGLVR